MSYANDEEMINHSGSLLTPENIQSVL